jgi:lysophospholipase L1-like esterase
MRLLLSILFLYQIHSFVAQEVIVREPVKFLALGDSYTIGQSVSQDESWPYQFKSHLESSNVEFNEIKVIARTGWTTTNLKNAIENDDLEGKYNLVALLIGVNNQYQGINQDLYVTEFTELLNIAISLAGGEDYVFVLSIPDYGYTPFGESNQEQISDEIDEYNQINQSITESKGVAYFNITEISRNGLINPSLVASDGLHPSRLMYQKWVELVAMGLVIGDVTTSRHNSKAENTKFDIYLNSVDKTVKFVLNPELFGVNAHLEIYSIYGQKLTSEIINSNKIITLPYSGIYVFKIFIENEVLYRGKIVI